jgi:Tol biopolymer transport system component
LTVPLASASGATPSGPERIGAFDGQTDVGAECAGCSATYDATREEYTVAGSGANMWDARDEFRFVWKRMSGDFILTARAGFVGKGDDPHRKLGWIVRSALDADSPHAAAEIHGDGLAALQFRRAKGGPTEEVRSAASGADVVRLERKGTTYTMSVARFGEPLAAVAVSDLALGDEVFAGLFVCSHKTGVVEKAVFRDVRLVVPVKEGFAPYRDYIGSHLETLDVETGDRRILLSSPESLQAPNWTPDGKALIYNAGGRLYRFDLARRTSTPIDTGFATSNNNDHVLSFDGKMLGISHHSAEDGGASIVYTLPASGGTPKRITAAGPSYLHGWSPDGKYLIYTAERGGDYDIYRIPAAGGAEVRLTTAKGLDDGSEYSPDGRYIYFNSVRSGTMQVWRMRPDGSGQEQVTDDGFNNWFPHVSPDGKRIVLLSYLSDVDPSDHPWYRRVYIRSMPASGGEPKVIAYVYGGQGTINVPSWSPDGRRVAFVSNSDIK